MIFPPPYEPHGIKIKFQEEQAEQIIYIYHGTTECKESASYIEKYAERHSGRMVMTHS